MKKANLILALLIALAMGFTGCKDDEVPALEYKSQGFIKGTVNGKTEGGADINGNFSYSDYVPSDGLGSIYDIDTSFDGTAIYSFYIIRREKNTSANVTLSFSLNNPTSTNPQFASMQMNYLKETSNEVTFFSMSTSENSKVEITDFSFDEKTGRVKGNYNLSGENSSTGKPGTVSGAFDVVVKKIIQ